MKSISLLGRMSRKTRPIILSATSRTLAKCTKRFAARGFNALLSPRAVVGGVYRIEQRQEDRRRQMQAGRIAPPPNRGAVRLATISAAMLACAGLLVPWRVSAVEPNIDNRTACATDFAVTKIDGDSNAVVVRILDPAAPPAGTISAYGHDRMWTGPVGRSVSTVSNGVREDSFVVRADAPIEGVEYAPSWASCTFHAGTRARNGYDKRDDVERPVLALANPQPVEPAACAHAYVSPAVTHGVDPMAPANADRVTGDVRVAVALDEHGKPQFTRVVSSPSPVLNGVAQDAAKRSEYTGAIFRCKPVPSGYEYAIQFI